MDEWWKRIKLYYVIFDLFVRCFIYGLCIFCKIILLWSFIVVIVVIKNVNLVKLISNGYNILGVIDGLLNLLIVVFWCSVFYYLIE